MKQPLTITKISSAVVHVQQASKRQPSKTRQKRTRKCFHYAVVQQQTELIRLGPKCPTLHHFTTYRPPTFGHRPLPVVKDLTSSHSTCWACSRDSGFDFQHRKAKPTTTSHLFCLDTEVVCPRTNSHSSPSLNGCQHYFYVFNVKLQ